MPRRDHEDQLVQMDSQDEWVQWAFQGHKDDQDHQDQKDHEETQVCQDPWDQLLPEVILKDPIQKPPELVE